MQIKKLYVSLSLAMSLLAGVSVSAQTTAFTYQGRLNDGANPTSGTYDLRFTIYDASTNGVAVGGPITNALTSVNNGLFNVTLDFGASPFTGADRWLEIGVRTNGSASPYADLSPRQQLTATPYAVRAANATSFTGSIADGQLSGNIARLNANQTFSGAVNFSGGSNNFSGRFTGNGTGVTNVNFETLTSSGTLRWGDFVLKSSPLLQGTPYFVMAADVNGDGRPDLITAGPWLEVLLNNGSGAFSGWYAHNFGSSVSSVATADINGDGKVDLITVRSSVNVLSILTNVGNGTFAAFSSMTVTGGPTAVVAVDVNADGKVDIVTANYSGSNISVLTNDGSGGFVLASSPALGDLHYPQALVSADVNGDGKADLITGNVGTDTLSVLTNDGSGGFVLASSPGVGHGPFSVVAADVNGDGKPDLISGNAYGNTLSVLTNDGNGGFVLSSSPVVGNAPGAVVAADVNGDGKPDLISANNAVAGTLSVLINNGSGGFVLSSSPSVGSLPYYLAAADVNGDGRVDVICANSGNNTLSVLFNALSFSAGNIGNITAGNVNWSSGASLADNQGGSLELGNSLKGGVTPFIDFHFGIAAAQDYNVRLINDASNRLSLFGDLLVNGSVTANSFSGNGANLTSLSASSLTAGSVPDARLAGTYSSALTLSNAANNISGNGAGLTALNASQLSSGTVPSARLVGTYTNVLTLSNAANSISGNGAGLTALNASQLSSGTLADARLAGTYSSVLTLNNVSNSFAGNGASLTSLNASQLSSGTVPDARLAGTYSGALNLSNPANVFSGNGNALNSLNASQLTDGTMPDGRLSGNVPRLSADQTFSGQNIFNNSVIGGGVTVDASSAPGGFNLRSTNVNRSSLSLAIAAGNFSTDASAGDTVLRSSAGKLLLQTGSGASAIAITNNLVGIGKANPATTLDVNGSATIASNLVVKGLASFGSNFLVLGPANFLTNLTVSGTALALSLNVLSDATAASLNVTGDATAARLGVGTNAPATALHVAAAGDTEISAQSTDSGGRRWTLQSSGAGTPGLTGSFQIIDRTAVASRLIIDTAGKVGVSTNNLFVTGGGENLRIVRGTVNADGSVVSGAGFTVSKAGTGLYTITFTTAFQDTPAVTATAVTDGVTSLDTLAAGSFGCGVHAGSVVGGNRADRQFSFIAIGSR